MHSIDDKNLPTDVKQRIENILAQHRITTDSIVNNPNTTINNPTATSFDTADSLQNSVNNFAAKEIKLDPSRTIMSKTDPKGIIEYANEYFMDICGYEEYELMGRPHNIIRHPDMPKVVFKLMWERLHKGENIYALVKNLAKNGDFYWVLTSFETKYNEEGQIISHYARRKAAPGNAVYQVEKLYKTLLAIEKTQSLEVAERYFAGMLEEKSMTYNEFILSVLGINEESIASYFVSPNSQTTNTPKKKGMFGRLFSS